jgi:Cu/Ag efflux protein CusF
MTKYLSVFVLAVAATALLAHPARAAQKPVTESAVVSATFTIEAIDHTSRVVTLKGADGSVESIVCGPDVKRFDALKVGDKVTFRYHESVVMQIRKAGDATPRPTDNAAMTRTPGQKPGGTLSQQVTARVMVEAIDPKVPSVSVKTEDARKMTFKVEDPKNLAGVKVGDHVEITYTQALAVSVQ